MIASMTFPHLQKKNNSSDYTLEAVSKPVDEQHDKGNLDKCEVDVRVPFVSGVNASAVLYP